MCSDGPLQLKGTDGSLGGAVASNDDNGKAYFIVDVFDDDHGAGGGGYSLCLHFAFHTCAGRADAARVIPPTRPYYLVMLHGR